MKIAVLSGKGGVGKTFIAVNLAVANQIAAYVDCDVEEPNGRLFLPSETVTKRKVYKELPVFDAAKCTGCRNCVDFCRFHALVYIKEKPKVFTDVCHSCGGCSFVCPNQAVTEVKQEIGVVEEGFYHNTRVITGILNTGEASGVKLIEAAIKAGQEDADSLIIDCPPGSACSVMESIKDADYCLLVVEPSAFGFHNFQMVYELAVLLGKPCGVVINKEEEVYQPLEDFLEEHKIPLLLKIPYEKEIAVISSKGKLLVEENKKYQNMFSELLYKIGGEG